MIQHVRHFMSKSVLLPIKNIKRNMYYMILCTASSGKDYDLTAFMKLIRVARKSDFHRFIIQPCFLLEGWEITKDTNRATVF